MLRHSTAVRAFQRGYAAAAATAAETPAGARANPTGEHTAKTTTLPNGLTVCSIDRAGALSRLAIAFRAGARYEDDKSLGLTHRLRNCVGHSAQSRTSIELLWRAGLLGASISATTTRDLFIVGMESWRDAAMPALEVLGEMACQPAFKQWEMVDDCDSLLTDRAVMKENNFARLMEILHKAAYRNDSLAHSIVAPKYNIKKFKTQQMLNFVNKHLVSGSATLVGINVDHDLLVKYAQDHMPINEGDKVATPSATYKGGESRKQNDGALAHVVIAGHCAGLKDTKGATAAAVLATALGSGPSVKWAYGAGAGSMIAEDASKSLGNSPFAVSSLVSLAEEQGLVGSYLVSEPNNINQLVKSTHSAIKNIASSGLNTEQLNSAKKRTAAHALMRAEDSGRVLEDLVAQVSATGNVQSPAEMLAAINNVTSADVQQVAKSMLAKPSMASVGNIRNVPYVDELA